MVFNRSQNMKYAFCFIALFTIIASCADKKMEDKKPTEKKVESTQYPMATVEKGGVATIIKLPAKLAAFEEVSIFPKMNGYVKSVAVDIGSKVSKGAVLMTLEAPELLQAETQAHEKLIRAQSDLAIDKERYDRLVEASKTAGAVSTFEISSIKAKVDADNAICNAETANWQMQQTMLDYLKVTAPFSGIITERNIHEGALVSAASKDKPMLELKQIDKLRLEVDIPEAIAAGLKIRDTISFYVSAYPGKKIMGNIARRSNNVSLQFRSERMEIDVNNTNGVLRPGMFAEVVLNSKGNATALTVPKTAVVTSTERKYVLLMKEGKMSKVDVSTGNETVTKIEIFGNLQVGDTVIASASDEIK